MKVGDRIKISGKDGIYIVTAVENPNQELIDNLNNLILELGDHPRCKEIESIRNVLVATSLPTYKAKIEFADPIINCPYPFGSDSLAESNSPSIHTCNVDSNQKRDKVSDLTNVIYTLANDRTKSSSEGYFQLCKLYSIPENQESADIFRKYKQSGSGLALVVQHFYAKYIDSLSDSLSLDFDEGEG